MVCAKQMGMSEQELMNSCPIFFIECYQKFLEKRCEEVRALYGR